MPSYEDRVLVAVSGGKDSRVLWDVLLDMGYRADGLYVGWASTSTSTGRRRLSRPSPSAAPRGSTPSTSPGEYGYDIPRAASARTRSSCGVRGLSKRYVFNRVALRHGDDVMATRHNLDDEAATLFGNVPRWQAPFVARQPPSFPVREGEIAREVKPSYRLGEGRWPRTA